MKTKKLFFVFSIIGLVTFVLFFSSPRTLSSCSCVNWHDITGFCATYCSQQSSQCYEIAYMFGGECIGRDCDWMYSYTCTNGHGTIKIHSFYCPEQCKW